MYMLDKGTEIGYRSLRRFASSSVWVIKIPERAYVVACKAFKKLTELFGIGVFTYGFHKQNDVFLFSRCKHLGQKP